MDQEHSQNFDDMVKLEFFANIGKAIAASATLKEVLDAVMSQIGSIFAPSNWSILLRRHSSGDLVFVKVTGSAVRSLKGQTLARGQGIAGWIAENGQPLVIPDVSNDPRFDSSMDAESGFKTNSIIGVPLKTRTRVFGVIELVNRLDGGQFSPYDLKLLTTIADFAAIAIEKIYFMQMLRKVAMTDSLTGIYNRRLLSPFIQREIERSRREKSPFAVLFIDIDDFKLINDQHGHDIGDQALKLVSTILHGNLRKSDFLCRFGGDEFVIVLSGQTRADAENLRQRIINSSELSTTIQGLTLSLSIGIHEALDGDVRDILKAVDRDMYDDKIIRMEQNLEDMPTALEDALEDSQEEV